MTDNNELLVQKIDFVLSDPEAFFSEESARALSFVRAALAQRQGEPVAWGGIDVTGKVKRCAMSREEIEHDGMRAVPLTAPATAEQPAQPLFVFEHEDGRYAVGPEGAAFTVGEPAWHRLGVVSLLVAAPVAEGLIDALARIKHCTQHVGDDLARTIRGIGFIADAAIASTKKDSTS